MRLMYFSFYMPPLLKDDDIITGGAAVQWKSWIYGFRKNCYEFGLLTYKGAKEYIGRQLDFDIIEAYYKDYGISKLRVIYYQIPLLIRSIKKYHPDYLIQGGATASTGILMLISKMLRIPFIHRIANDPDVDERIYKMVHKREIFLYKLGVKYADYIFVQNSYQYKKLKEKYSTKKIHILPNPFQVEIKEKELLSRKDRNFVAWVANFRYMKNMPELLKIASAFPNLKFKIAGQKHQNLDKETEFAIRELEKLKNVEFVGYLRRKEIVPFYLNAIALLNTSHFEGFSNTFLEAWSCGVPVVSTKNVNPDGIISKYNLGVVAEDYDSLPQSLEKIINMDTTEYEKLSLHCYEYVKKYHDPKMLAAKFVEYLENNKT